MKVFFLCYFHFIKKFFLITLVFDLIIKFNIFLSLIRDLANLFFISLKVGISFLLMSSENINIFPFEVKFFG